MKEVILTEEQLVAKCKEWQVVLRLQDWDVKAGIFRERDMAIGGEGECDWNLTRKIASIRILDPIDYPEGAMIPMDMEDTLVHELLHLHFAPFFNEEKSTEQEQAINSITNGLISLARGG